MKAIKNNLAVKAIRELKKQQESDDQEEAHIEADDVLCKLLTVLGFQNVVEEYEKVGKWYA